MTSDTEQNQGTDSSGFRLITTKHQKARKHRRGEKTLSEPWSMTTILTWGTGREKWLRRLLRTEQEACRRAPLVLYRVRMIKQPKKFPEATLCAIWGPFFHLSILSVCKNFPLCWTKYLGEVFFLSFFEAMHTAVHCSTRSNTVAEH